MRTLLLSKPDEIYLQKCAQEHHKLSYGIIIGHYAEPEKTVVVHLAKNNEEDIEVEDMTTVASIGDINSQLLTSQWISASKMCSGSFEVLGIFVSSENSDIVSEQTEDFKNAKSLLADIYDLLLKDNTFCSIVNEKEHSEYIFLAYSASEQKTLCKIYTNNNNGGTFLPMDCRFVEKPFEWITFECSYELDDVYPVIDGTRRINIEQQYQHTIHAVRNSLTACEIFLQNENVDDALQLQAYIKKKKVHMKSGGAEDNVYKATIYLPVKCQLSKNAPIKVREFGGTIRLAGSISSRIHCSPRNTLGDVKRFLRNDILRSLAARIQVYCDGLTEPHISKELIFLSEPPRRVYFSLPTSSAANSSSPVQFSEYIFRGEAPTVAVAQAKQILDLDIAAEMICLDNEGLPEDENLLSLSSSFDKTSVNTSSMPPRELTRSMYMLGIAVALLVLFAAVGLHYLMGK